MVGAIKAGDAECFVVCCGGLGCTGGVAVRAVCCLQDAAVAVHHRLDFGRGVDLGAGDAVGTRGGQQLVDGDQQCLVGKARCVVDTGHAGDADVGVVLCRWHGVCARVGPVVVGVALNHAQRSGGVGGQGLQFGQAVGGTAVIGLNGNCTQYGAEVAGRGVVGDAGDANFGEVGGGQGLAGGVSGSDFLDVVGNAGQLVDFGDGVDLGGALCTDDVIEQCQFEGICGGVTDVGANGCVVAGQRVLDAGVWDVVACVRCVGVVGFGQDFVVGVNHGFDFRACGLGRICKFVGRLGFGQGVCV